MNNPRIAELLNGCNTFIRDGEEFADVYEIDTELHCGDRWKNKTELCTTCKAELLGILGQMKCEVEFLEKIRKEYLVFSTEVSWNNSDFFIRLEELNSDIKTIEEALK